MTRIVAGSAKGRRLRVPARGTRPTSERAREALFSSLAATTDLAGARVVDLYAGSGAVGLEALSRGAGAATFVESDRAACAVLRANIAAVAVPGATVRPMTVGAFLAASDETAPDNTAPYDLAFADPPYALGDDDLAAVLDALAAPDRLAPGAIVVVERSAHGGPPRWPTQLTPLRERRYGESVLWYGHRP